MKMPADGTDSSAASLWLHKNDKNSLIRGVTKRRGGSSTHSTMRSCSPVLSARIKQNNGVIITPPRRPRSEAADDDDATSCTSSASTHSSRRSSMVMDSHAYDHLSSVMPAEVRSIVPTGFSGSAVLTGALAGDLMASAAHKHAVPTTASTAASTVQKAASRYSSSPSLFYLHQQALLESKEQVSNTLS